MSQKIGIKCPYRWNPLALFVRRKNNKDRPQASPRVCFETILREVKVTIRRREFQGSGSNETEGCVGGQQRQIMAKRYVN